MPPRRCRWQTAVMSSRRVGSSKRGRPRPCSKVPTFSGHTSVSRASVWPLLPAANGAGLAMISPANTDECLTQEPPDGHCQGLAARLRSGGGNNYFRVVTTQLMEGLAGADLAYQTLARRRAFVLTDQTPVGLASATQFADRFTKDGGT